MTTVPPGSKVLTVDGFDQYGQIEDIKLLKVPKSRFAQIRNQQAQQYVNLQNSIGAAMTGPLANGAISTAQFRQLAIMGSLPPPINPSDYDLPIGQFVSALGAQAQLGAPLQIGTQSGNPQGVNIISSGITRIQVNGNQADPVAAYTPYTQGQVSIANGFIEQREIPVAVNEVFAGSAGTIAGIPFPFIPLGTANITIPAGITAVPIAVPANSQLTGSGDLELPEGIAFPTAIVLPVGTTIDNAFLLPNGTLVPANLTGITAPLLLPINTNLPLGTGVTIPGTASIGSAGLILPAGTNNTGTAIIIPGDAPEAQEFVDLYLERGSNAYVYNVQLQDGTSAITEGNLVFPSTLTLGVVINNIFLGQRPGLLNNPLIPLPNTIADYSNAAVVPTQGLQLGISTFNYLLKIVNNTGLQLALAFAPSGNVYNQIQINNTISGSPYFIPDGGAAFFQMRVENGVEHTMLSNVVYNTYTQQPAPVVV